MKKKIKFTIYIACTLWLVVFAQIVITKVYVKRNDMAQAFARNQLAIEGQSAELKEVCKEGGWVLGKIPGKLSSDEKERIAEELFGYEGGASLMSQETGDFYVAYGYTHGINIIKKVNGETINMNVAITYDEQEDKSLVYFGVPILNLDF